MGLRDRKQPGGISLCQERKQGETEATTSPCRGNSCRIQPRASSSEVGQDARLPTSPEANPAVVPDGCLAPRTSLGLSQSCWDPHGLGESHPCLVCGLQAGSGRGAGPPSHVCFHCRCWQVWKLHMESLWWPHSPSSAHSWSTFGVGGDAGSVTEGVFKMLHVRKRCSGFFGFFYYEPLINSGWHTLVVCTGCAKGQGLLLHT